MHFKNGREAKNGDQVVMVENEGKLVVSGILHSASGSDNTCNGSIRQVNGQDHYANLSKCVHAEDILKATIPDSTKVEVAEPEPAAAEKVD